MAEPSHRLIKTARPFGLGDDIPKPNSTPGQPLQSLWVLEVLKPQANSLSQQPPELISRMGIISLLSE